jgi:hypothetical protein
MFDEDSGRSVPQKSFQAKQRPAHPATAATSPHFSHLNHLFSPSHFGLIGLALAVFLWGFGYKLSLYYQAPSRGTVVKMWVEQRNSSAIFGSTFNAKFSPISDSQALPGAVQVHLPDRSSITCIAHIVRRNPNYSAFLIPFRSPPAHRFLLT